jgi:GNAT superfamily N-acetyltransferase
MLAVRLAARRNSAAEHHGPARWRAPRPWRSPRWAVSVPERSTQLFVDPQHVGRGVGRQLLAAVADAARDAGLPALLSHVS